MKTTVLPWTLNHGLTPALKRTLHAIRRQAVSVEADCVEAIYNLGLVNKRLGQREDALVAFKKLHTILPESLEVLFQIGNVYELLGNFKQAVKWFELLHSRGPYDPGVLARLGAIHSKTEDEAKALHYYSESHRVYPVNMDVISWCGSKQRLPSPRKQDYRSTL
jgi:intraflagellar transport protein 88